MTHNTTSTRLPILCGVDRSPHARSAASVAIALARRLGRPLELVHVIEDPPRPSSDGAMRTVQAVLEEHLDADGIGVRLGSGCAASALTAAGQGSSLLVVGSRGEGSVRAAPLGSVSAALHRNPPCPTIVVPSTSRVAGEELMGRAIVCAVRDERDALDAHAAAGLASALGQALTLAHVVPRTSGPTPTGPAPARHEDAYRMLEAIARPIAVSLARATELRVLEGAPGPQLDRLAVAEDASMFVVGASASGPLVAALAGSPSRHLMRHGRRPVLIYPSGRRAMTRHRRRGHAPAAAFAWQGHG